MSDASEMAEKSIWEAISSAQADVVVPKAKYNAFGKFHYRSFEDLVSSVKRACAKHGLVVTLSDEVVAVGERTYVRSTATARFADGGDGEASATAYAREDEHKKGSDDAQVTGMASSYARKYALCGLFAVDGDGDPDEAAPAENPKGRQAPESGPFTARCRTCGTAYTFSSREQYEAFAATATCCGNPDWVVDA